MRFEEGSMKKTPKQAILSIQEEIRRDVEKERLLKQELTKIYIQDVSPEERGRGRSRLRSRASRSVSEDTRTKQRDRPKTASSVEEKSDSSIGGDNKKLANSQQISHNKPTNFQYKESSPKLVSVNQKFSRNKSLGRNVQRPSIEEFIGRYAIKKKSSSFSPDRTFYTFSEPPTIIKKTVTGKRMPDNPEDVINQELRDMYIREVQHRRSQQVLNGRSAEEKRTIN